MISEDHQQKTIDGDNEFVIYNNLAIGKRWQIPQAHQTFAEQSWMV